MLDELGLSLVSIQSQNWLVLFQPNQPIEQGQMVLGVLVEDDHAVDGLACRCWELLSGNHGSGFDIFIKHLVKYRGQLFFGLAR
jgi:hypothetical protein